MRSRLIAQAWQPPRSAVDLASRNRPHRRRDAIAAPGTGAGLAR